MTALKKTHRKLRQGGYLAATTAIVVAIVVFLNLIVGQLPTHLLEFDLSDKQLYTVTDTSKEFLAGLDKDVEIVVLAEESNVDERIAKFLDNYAALSTQVTDAVEKANLTLESTSLLLNGSVPEDCSLLISYGASKDLTDDELTLIREYLDGGGQVMFVLAQTEEEMPNWETLMAEYGLTLADGYVADTARYYPQLGSAYAIAPVLSSESAITSGFSDDDLTLMVNVRGMTELETLPDNVTVTPFLETSSSGVAVTEDGTQTQGTYLLGAVCQKTDEDGNAAGRLTVISSASLVDDSVLNTIPNGVNLDVFMNAVTDGFEDIDNISIEAKSLETTYNTIQNAGSWSLLFIAVIPLLTLIVGLVYWLRRRKL